MKKRTCMNCHRTFWTRCRLERAACKPCLDPAKRVKRRQRAKG